MNKLLILQNYKGSLIAAAILLYLMRPYFTWNNILGSNLLIVPASLLLGLLFYFNRDLGKEKQFLWILFLLVFVLSTIFREHNINYLISIIPFSLIPFGDKNFTKSIYNNFLNIYCFIMICSVLVWILYLFGLAPMLGTIAPLNELKLYNYNVYPLLVCATNSPRFCSIFDEPGVVGTINALLLLCQKFTFKDKKTIILLISGLCSTSLFFYLICGIGFVLKYLTDKQKIINVALIIIVIYAAYIASQNVPLLYEAIGYRFEFDTETGRLAGDNRTDDNILYYFTMILGTKQFWFGLENPTLFLQMMEGECNIYMTILLNGAFLCLLYLSFMLIYGWTNKIKYSTYILFLVVFLCTIYQRPFLFGAEYIFLWTYSARLDKL